MKTFFYAIFLSVILVACGNETNTTDTTSDTDSTQATPDTLVSDIANDAEQEATKTTEDTIGTEGIATDVEEVTEEEIVKETGMSFCDCVKKQEALQKEIENTDDDDKLMALMDEMKKFREGECRVLFIGNQTSVEDIAERKRKIEACK